MSNLLTSVLLYFFSSPTLRGVSFSFAMFLAVCFLIIRFGARR